MDSAPAAKPISETTSDARDLQARLYREIGISAVAAALRFTTQPDPAVKKPESHALPPFLRRDDVAA